MSNGWDGVGYALQAILEGRALRRGGLFKASIVVALGGGALVLALVALLSLVRA